MRKHRSPFNCRRSRNESVNAARRGASAWMPRQYAHIAIVRRPEPHEFSGTGHHIGLNTARAKSGT
jgi:hypothetical protein